MKKFFSVLLWLFLAPFNNVQAQCLEYRTNSYNYNYTNWYSSKQETCTASAEEYQNKINENYPGVVDYVGTLSSNGAICHRNGTVTYGNGQVGGIAPQDVGWFQERSCQYKPEEASCSVGNPTLPGLGTKTHNEPIYAGTFAAPLSFELSYRSAYSGRSMLPGGAWLHTYSGRLQIDSLVADVHALAADGSVVRFTKGSTVNTWVSAESGDTLNRLPTTDPTAVVWELQRRRDNTRETYDHTGKLLKITALNGWVTSLSYNAPGQLQSVSNAFGRQLGFTWDANGFLSALTTPGGDVTRYSHDTQGNLITVTWPDGNIKRYHYEDSRFPRALTGITDESGQRIGSYTYDAQGRVSETQRASGVDRMQFSYGTDATGLPQTQITDFSSGTPTTRTYNFVQQGRVLRPSGVSSPCPLCGSTARSTQYDAAGRKTREVSHDGSVIFYTYNAAGQETERATFPASFSSATTRPALSNATSVVSTMWDGTSNLPFRIAEPGRSTTYNYTNTVLILTNTYATTDTTGALKFNGTPTGPTSSTQYGYNANKLNTSITELTNGVQTQRWNLAYDALGDLTSITDVTAGSAVAQVTQIDVGGRITAARQISGAELSVAYNQRGFPTEYRIGGLFMRFMWTSFGALQRIEGPGSDLVIYEYDSSQRLIGVRKLLTTIAESDDGLIRFAKALRRLVESPFSPAHAQVLPVFTPVPGGAMVGGGVAGRPPVPLGARDLLMPSQSPSDPNRELARRLGESFQTIVDRLICSDECKRLQAEIQEWTGSVRKRHFEMVVDKNNLFCARPDGRNSWSGHQQRYRSSQSKLIELIQRAKSISCPYNPEADDWAYRPAPICPG